METMSDMIKIKNEEINLRFANLKKMQDQMAEMENE